MSSFFFFHGKAGGRNGFYYRYSFFLFLCQRLHCEVVTRRVAGLAGSTRIFAAEARHTYVFFQFFVLLVQIILLLILFSEGRRLNRFNIALSTMLTEIVLTFVTRLVSYLLHF